MGEVVPLRPQFDTAAEALRWFEVNDTDEIRRSARPPVDFCEDEIVNSYLATVFCGLLRMPGISVRVAHLHAKAEDEMRQGDRVRKTDGELAASTNYRIAHVMRKWATELVEAGARHAAGG